MFVNRSSAWAVQDHLVAKHRPTGQHLASPEESTHALHDLTSHLVRRCPLLGDIPEPDLTRSARGRPTLRENPKARPVTGRGVLPSCREAAPMFNRQSILADLCAGRPTLFSAPALVAPKG